MTLMTSFLHVPHFYFLFNREEFLACCFGLDGHGWYFRVRSGVGGRHGKGKGRGQRAEGEAYREWRIGSWSGVSEECCCFNF